MPGRAELPAGGSSLPLSGTGWCPRLAERNGLDKPAAWAAEIRGAQVGGHRLEVPSEAPRRATAGPAGRPGRGVGRSGAGTARMLSLRLCLGGLLHLALFHPQPKTCCLLGACEWRRGDSWAGRRGGGEGPSPKARDSACNWDAFLSSQTGVPCGENHSVRYGQESTEV